MRTAKYQLILFDMDGTLTEELLDFAAIRREIGVAENVGILEHLATLSGEPLRRATAILDRHEMAAAERCVLHPGAEEVLAALAQRRIPTALLTRNSAACAERIIQRHQLKLDCIATRDNRPHKPHPDAILNITRRFDIPPEQTLMVGDYLYDLQTAAAAKTDSALLCMRDNGRRPAYATMATYCIDSLLEILPLIDGCDPTT